MRVPKVSPHADAQHEAAAGAARNDDWRAWLPLTRDPVLLAERRGRWRWYWALAFTLALPVLAIFALSFGEDGLVRLAALAGLSINPGAVPSETVYVPGNIDSFIAEFTVSAAVVIAVLAILRLWSRGTPWGFSFGAPVHWRHFWKAGGALFVTHSVTTLVTYALDPGSFSMNRYGMGHIVWFAAAIPIILTQTLAEELLFRSFLLRVWGAVFPYRMAVILVTGGVFIAIHAENPDVKLDPWFFIIQFAVSLVLYYWLLFRTRSIMAAWGMHWCHNVFVILIVTTKPGWNNEIALFTSVDPVLSAGGSYLFNLEGYIWLAMHMAVFVALTAWRQSPFHIAPVAALPEPAPPQGALPEEDALPDAATRSDLAPAPTQA